MRLISFLLVGAATVHEGAGYPRDFYGAGGFECYSHDAPTGPGLMSEFSTQVPSGYASFVGWQWCQQQCNAGGYRFLSVNSAGLCKCGNKADHDKFVPAPSCTCGPEGGWSSNGCVHSRAADGTETDCIKLAIGSSGGNTKSVNINAQYRCPSFSTCNPAHSTSNQFTMMEGCHNQDAAQIKLQQSGGTVTVTRIDTTGGWGEDLKVDCCKLLPVPCYYKDCTQCRGACTVPHATTNTPNRRKDQCQCSCKSGAPDYHVNAVTALPTSILPNDITNAQHTPATIEIACGADNEIGRRDCPNTFKFCSYCVQGMYPDTRTRVGANTVHDSDTWCNLPDTKEMFMKDNTHDGRQWDACMAKSGAKCIAVDDTTTGSATHLHAERNNAFSATDPVVKSSGAEVYVEMKMIEDTQSYVEKVWIEHAGKKYDCEPRDMLRVPRQSLQGNEPANCWIPDADIGDNGQGCRRVTMTVRALSSTHLSNSIEVSIVVDGQAPYMDTYLHHDDLTKWYTDYPGCNDPRCADRWWDPHRKVKARLHFVDNKFTENNQELECAQIWVEDVGYQPQGKARRTLSEVGTDTFQATDPARGTKNISYGLYELNEQPGSAPTSCPAPPATCRLSTIPDGQRATVIFDVQDKVGHLSTITMEVWVDGSGAVYGAQSADGLPHYQFFGDSAPSYRIAAKVDGGVSELSRSPTTSISTHQLWKTHRAAAFLQWPLGGPHGTLPSTVDPAPVGTYYDCPITNKCTLMDNRFLSLEASTPVSGVFSSDGYDAIPIQAVPQTGLTTHMYLSDDHSGVRDGTLEIQGESQVALQYANAGNRLKQQYGRWSATLPTITKGSHMLTAGAVNYAGLGPLKENWQIFIDDSAPLVQAGKRIEIGVVSTQSNVDLGVERRGIWSSSKGEQHVSRLIARDDNSEPKQPTDVFIPQANSMHINFTGVFEDIQTLIWQHRAELRIRPPVVPDTAFAFKAVGTQQFARAASVTAGAQGTLDACGGAGAAATGCRWVFEDSTTRTGYKYIRLRDSATLYLSSALSGNAVSLQTCDKQQDLAACQWKLEHSPTRRFMWYIHAAGTTKYLRADGTNSLVVLDSCPKHITGYVGDTPECQWQLEGRAEEPQAVRNGTVPCNCTSVCDANNCQTYMGQKYCARVGSAVCSEGCMPHVDGTKCIAPPDAPPMLWGVEPVTAAAQRAGDSTTPSIFGAPPQAWDGNRQMTLPGGVPTSGWVFNAEATAEGPTPQNTMFNRPDGTEIYAVVAACNFARQCTAFTSVAAIVDDSPPEVIPLRTQEGCLELGEGGAGERPCFKHEIRWRMRDLHSGIKKVSWTIALPGAGRKDIITADILSDIFNCTPAAALHNDCRLDWCECTGLFSWDALNAAGNPGMEPGRTYIVELNITNGRLLTKETTWPYVADGSAAEAGVVRDGPNGGEDIDFISNDTLCATWGGFQDAQSGIAKTTLRWVDGADPPHIVVPLTHVGTTAALCATGVGMVHGTRYHAEVTAHSGSGGHAVTQRSNGVVYAPDPAEPTAAVVKARAKRGDTFFPPPSTVVAVTWEPFGRPPLVPMISYSLTLKRTGLVYVEAGACVAADGATLASCSANLSSADCFAYCGGLTDCEGVSVSGWNCTLYLGSNSNAPSGFACSAGASGAIGGANATEEGTCYARGPIAPALVSPYELQEGATCAATPSLSVSALTDACSVKCAGGAFAPLVVDQAVEYRRIEWGTWTAGVITSVHPDGTADIRDTASGGVLRKWVPNLIRRGGVEATCDGASGDFANAVCGTEVQCRALCDAEPLCTAVVMHARINKCFLKGAGCSAALGASADWNYLEKQPNVVQVFGTQHEAFLPALGFPGEQYYVSLTGRTAAGVDSTSVAGARLDTTPPACCRGALWEQAKLSGAPQPVVAPITGGRWIRNRTQVCLRVLGLYDDETGVTAQVDVLDTKGAMVGTAKFENRAAETADPDGGDATAFADDLSGCVQTPPAAEGATYFARVQPQNRVGLPFPPFAGPRTATGEILPLVLETSAPVVLPPWLTRSGSMVGSVQESGQGLQAAAECTDQGSGIASLQLVLRPAPAAPSAAAMLAEQDGTPPTYAANAGKDCPGNDIDTSWHADRCYSKCGNWRRHAPHDSTGECDGNLVSYGPDSTVLCVNATECKALCDEHNDCYAIVAHKTLRRCFLKGPACSHGALTTDANYDVLVKPARYTKTAGSQCTKGALDVTSQSEQCFRKCGAGTTGDCDGNAPYGASANVLCVSEARCKELCDANPYCYGATIETARKSCKLHGMGCSGNALQASASHAFLAKGSQYAVYSGKACTGHALHVAGHALQCRVRCGGSTTGACDGNNVTFSDDSNFLCATDQECRDACTSDRSCYGTVTHTSMQRCYLVAVGCAAQSARQTAADWRLEVRPDASTFGTLLLLKLYSAVPQQRPDLPAYLPPMLIPAARANESVALSSAPVGVPFLLVAECASGAGVRSTAVGGPFLVAGDALLAAPRVHDSQTSSPGPYFASGAHLDAVVPASHFAVDPHSIRIGWRRNSSTQAPDWLHNGTGGPAVALPGNLPRCEWLVVVAHANVTGAGATSVSVPFMVLSAPTLTVSMGNSSTKEFKVTWAATACGGVSAVDLSVREALLATPGSSGGALLGRTAGPPSTSGTVTVTATATVRDGDTLVGVANLTDPAGQVATAVSHRVVFDSSVAGGHLWWDSVRAATSASTALPALYAIRDPHSGLAEITPRVNCSACGGIVWTGTPVAWPAPEGSVSVSLGSSPVPGRKYTAEVVAKNGAGISAVFATHPVIFSSNPPSFRSTPTVGPTPGVQAAFIRSAALHFTVDATDADTGHFTATAALLESTGAVASAAEAVHLTDAAGGLLEGILDVSAAQTAGNYVHDGRYKVRVTLSNAAGLSASADSAEFTARLLAPGSGAGNTVVVSGCETAGNGAPLVCPCTTLTAQWDFQEAQWQPVDGRFRVSVRHSTSGATASWTEVSARQVNAKAWDTFNLTSGGPATAHAPVGTWQLCVAPAISDFAAREVCSGELTCALSVPSAGVLVVPPVWRCDNLLKFSWKGISLGGTPKTASTFKQEWRLDGGAWTAFLGDGQAHSVTLTNGSHSVQGRVQNMLGETVSTTAFSVDLSPCSVIAVNPQLPLRTGSQGTRYYTQSTHAFGVQVDAPPHAVCRVRISATPDAVGTAGWFTFPCNATAMVTAPDNVLTSGPAYVLAECAARGTEECTGDPSNLAFGGTASASHTVVADTNAPHITRLFVPAITPDDAPPLCGAVFSAARESGKTLHSLLQWNAGKCPLRNSDTCEPGSQGYVAGEVCLTRYTTLNVQVNLDDGAGSGVAWLSITAGGHVVNTTDVAPQGQTTAVQVRRDVPLLHEGVTRFDVCASDWAGNVGCASHDSHTASPFEVISDTTPPREVSVSVLHDCGAWVAAGWSGGADAGNVRFVAAAGTAVGKSDWSEWNRVTTSPINFTQISGHRALASGFITVVAEDAAGNVAVGSAALPKLDIATGSPQAPTTAPTAHPSVSPSTESPTTSPTDAPTGTPSAAPSGSPTAPTAAPSVSPSASPTATGVTRAPSTSPTAVPTSPPSGLPSLRPSSAAPSASPSRRPTAAPTTAPSGGPTGSPTTSPTAAPTNGPTPRAAVETGSHESYTVYPGLVCPVDRFNTSGEAEQCHSKCGTNSSKAGCNGTAARFTSGSAALCTNEARCRALCDARGSSCYAISRHRTLDLCWLHGRLCATADLAEAPDYQLELRGDTLHARLLPGGTSCVSYGCRPVASRTECEDVGLGLLARSETALTEAPSSSPTRHPSLPPTGSPTFSPSVPPSGAPSVAPSTAPTLGPTSPTVPPTSSPQTAGPSAAPSTPPTKAPSVAPSAPPTTTPSSNPTQTATPTAPTVAPSMAPTSPSVSPTTPPSPLPTASPTGPSASPSAAPTRGPTRSPSPNPTGSPSFGQPTGSPTLSPGTSSPSLSPSVAHLVGCHWHSTQHTLHFAARPPSPEVQPVCRCTLPALPTGSIYIALGNTTAYLRADAGGPGLGPCFSAGATPAAGCAWRLETAPQTAGGWRLRSEHPNGTAAYLTHAMALAPACGASDTTCDWLLEESAVAHRGVVWKIRGGTQYLRGGETAELPAMGLCAGVGEVGSCLWSAEGWAQPAPTTSPATAPPSRAPAPSLWPACPRLLPLPPQAFVADGAGPWPTDLDFLTDRETVRCSWQIDANSSAVGYSVEWGVGTHPGADDAVPLRPAMGATSASAPFRVSHGVMYYCVVRTLLGGAAHVYHADGAMADLTPLRPQAAAGTRWQSSYNLLGEYDCGAGAAHITAARYFFGSACPASPYTTGPVGSCPAAGTQGPGSWGAWENIGGESGIARHTLTADSSVCFAICCAAANGLAAVAVAPEVVVDTAAPTVANLSAVSLFGSAALPKGASGGPLAALPLAPGAGSFGLRWRALGGASPVASCSAHFGVAPFPNVPVSPDLAPTPAPPPPPTASPLASTPAPPQLVFATDVGTSIAYAGDCSAAELARISARGAASALPLGAAPYSIELFLRTTDNAAAEAPLVSWGMAGAGLSTGLALGRGASMLRAFWDRSPGEALLATVGNPDRPGYRGLADGQWHHVAGTFDGTRRRIFLDYAELASDEPAAAHRTNITSNFHVGCAERASTNFSGTLRDVRIHAGAPQPRQHSPLTYAPSSSPTTASPTGSSTSAPSAAAATVEWFTFNGTGLALDQIQHDTVVPIDVTCTSAAGRASAPVRFSVAVHTSAPSAGAVHHAREVGVPGRGGAATTAVGWSGLEDPNVGVTYRVRGKLANGTTVVDMTGLTQQPAAFPVPATAMVLTVTVEACNVLGRCTTAGSPWPLAVSSSGALAAGSWAASDHCSGNQPTCVFSSIGGVRLGWSGFAPDLALDRYDVAFGATTVQMKHTPGGGVHAFRVQAADFAAQTTFAVSVVGVDRVGVRTPALTATVTIDSSPPAGGSVTGTATPLANGTVRVDCQWTLPTSAGGLRATMRWGIVDAGGAHGSGGPLLSAPTAALAATTTVPGPPEADWQCTAVFLSRAGLARTLVSAGQLWAPPPAELSVFDGAVEGSDAAFTDGQGLAFSWHTLGHPSVPASGSYAVVKYIPAKRCGTPSINAAALADQCVAKCGSRTDTDCSGNPADPADTAAVCAPKARCRELCLADNNCDGFDMHRGEPLCYLKAACSTSDLSAAADWHYVSRADVAQAALNVPARSGKLSGPLVVPGGDTDGDGLYVEVKLCWASGGCKVGSSSGVLIDTVVPARGQVTVSDVGGGFAPNCPQASGAGRRCVAAVGGRVNVAWSGFSDSGSGLAHYEVGVYTDNMVLLHGPVDVGLDTAAELHVIGMFASPAVKYATIRAKVTAYDRAGLQESQPSEIVVVESQPPPVPLDAWARAVVSLDGSVALTWGASGADPVFPAGGMQSGVRVQSCISRALAGARTEHCPCRDRDWKWVAANWGTDGTATAVSHVAAHSGTFAENCACTACGTSTDHGFISASTDITTATTGGREKCAELCADTGGCVRSYLSDASCSLYSKSAAVQAAQSGQNGTCWGAADGCLRGEADCAKGSVDALRPGAYVLACVRGVSGVGLISTPIAAPPVRFDDTPPVVGKVHAPDWSMSNAITFFFDGAQDPDTGIARCEFAARFATQTENPSSIKGCLPSGPAGTCTVAVPGNATVVVAQNEGGADYAVIGTLTCTNGAGFSASSESDGAKWENRAPRFDPPEEVQLPHRCYGDPFVARWPMCHTQSGFNRYDVALDWDREENITAGNTTSPSAAPSVAGAEGWEQNTPRMGRWERLIMPENVGELRQHTFTAGSFIQRGRIYRYAVRCWSDAGRSSDWYSSTFQFINGFPEVPDVVADGPPRAEAHLPEVGTYFTGCNCNGCQDTADDGFMERVADITHLQPGAQRNCAMRCIKTAGCKRMWLTVSGCALYSKGAVSLTSATKSNSTCWVSAAPCASNASAACAAGFLFDVDVQMETNVARAHWSSPFGNIQSLDACVGRTAADCAALNWTSLLPMQEEVSLPDVKMINNYGYVTRLRACSKCGRCVLTATDGFVVESNRPLEPAVFAGPTGTTVVPDKILPTSEAVMHWAGSPESVECMWAIGEGVGSISVMDWVVVSCLGGEERMGGIPLREGLIFYHSVRVCNRVQLCTTGAAKPVRVSAHPVVVQEVSMTQFGADVDVIQKGAPWGATWNGFAALHSAPIEHYEWAIDTHGTPTLSITLPSETVSRTASVTATLPSVSASVTLTESYTLPTLTGTATDTVTLPSASATATDTFTLPTITDTATASLTLPSVTSTETLTATASLTESFTLPSVTATTSETLTLPTVTRTEELTQTVTSTGSLTATKTETAAQTETLTGTETVTLPERTVTGTETFTLPSGTATPPQTLTATLPTQTATATVTLPQVTSTVSETFSLPTLTQTSIRTQTVTIQPTGAPTASPTSSPTAPTASPSASPVPPSGSPTSAPTMPTVSPSLSPTSPSSSPSAPPTAPTASPSGTPTAPSAAPTVSPSGPPISPTAAPTAPTAAPTLAPTAPTVAPTTAPTAPSVSPSFAPTAPSVSPSFAPTAPSASPTGNPTGSPSTTASTATARRLLQTPAPPTFQDCHRSRRGIICPPWEANWTIVCPPEGNASNIVYEDNLPAIPKPCLDLLESGRSYRVIVRAVYADAVAHTQVSNGITVSSERPQPLSVSLPALVTAFAGLTITWEQFRVELAPVVQYSVRLVTTHGQHVVDARNPFDEKEYWIVVGLDTSYTFIEPKLAEVAVELDVLDGQAVWAEVKACNAGGACGIGKSNETEVLLSAPPPPIIWDGHTGDGWGKSKDQAVTVSTDTLKFGFTPCGQLGSKSMRHEWCIGTAKGSCDTVSWQEVTASAATGDKEITVPGLTLAREQMYYANVRCTNIANFTAWSSSSGVFVVTIERIDDSLCGTVYGGLEDRVAKPYQAEADRFSTHWVDQHTAFSPGTAVYGFGVELRDSAGVPIALRRSVGFAQQQKWSGLRLRHGESYYATVDVLTGRGQCLRSAGTPTLIDMTHPTAPNISVPALVRSVSEAVVTVTAPGTDAESGIDEVRVAVGTTRYGTQAMLFQKVNKHNPQISLATADLRSGALYYATVVVSNGAGLTAAALASFRTDWEPPQISVEAIPVSSDDRAVEALWQVEDDSGGNVTVTVELVVDGSTVLTSGVQPAVGNKVFSLPEIGSAFLIKVQATDAAGKTSVKQSREFLRSTAPSCGSIDIAAGGALRKTASDGLVHIPPTASEIAVLWGPALNAGAAGLNRVNVTSGPSGGERSSAVLEGPLLCIDPLGIGTPSELNTKVTAAAQSAEGAWCAKPASADVVWDSPAAIGGLELESSVSCATTPAVRPGAVFRVRWVVTNSTSLEWLRLLIGTEGGSGTVVQQWLAPNRTNWTHDVTMPTAFRDGWGAYVTVAARSWGGLDYSEALAIPVDARHPDVSHFALYVPRVVTSTTHGNVTVPVLWWGASDLSTSVCGAKLVLTRPGNCTEALAAAAVSYASAGAVNLSAAPGAWEVCAAVVDDAGNEAPSKSALVDARVATLRPPRLHWMACRSGLLWVRMLAPGFDPTTALPYSLNVSVNGALLATELVTPYDKQVQLVLPALRSVDSLQLSAQPQSPTDYNITWLDTLPRAKVAANLTRLLRVGCFGEEAQAAP